MARPEAETGVGDAWTTGTGVLGSLKDRPSPEALMRNTDGS